MGLAWAVVVLARGGSWWGPIHAFLAGTVLLAISGASQMFTITWAAVKPPTRLLTTTQRWLVAAGVASAPGGRDRALGPSPRAWCWTRSWWGWEPS